jgi:hypothetical protein
MLDRRDPECMQQREVAEVLLAQNWREGLIGDATYLRSLMMIGYGDRDARTELSLLRMEKRRRR